MDEFNIEAELASVLQESNTDNADLSALGIEGEEEPKKKADAGFEGTGLEDLEEVSASKEETDEEEQEKEEVSGELDHTYLQNISEKYGFEIEGLDQDIDVKTTLDSIFEGLVGSIQKQNDYIQELQTKNTDTTELPTELQEIKKYLDEGKSLADFAKSYKNASVELEQWIIDVKNSPKEKLIKEYYLTQKIADTPEEADALYAELKQNDAIDTEYKKIIKQVENVYQTQKKAIADDILKQELEATEKQKQAFEQQYQNDLKEINEILSKTNDIEGFPLDAEKKKQLYILTTQINPETGRTALEEKLLSNKNALMAAFFLTYGETFAKHVATANKEKGKKMYFDKLPDKPINNKNQGNKVGGFNYEAFNQLGK